MTDKSYTPWHTFSIDYMLDRLSVNAEEGLPQAEWEDQGSIRA